MARRAKKGDMPETLDLTIGNYGCEVLGDAFQNAVIFGCRYVVKMGSLYYPLGLHDADNFRAIGVPFEIVAESKGDEWGFKLSYLSADELCRYRKATGTS